MFFLSNDNNLLLKIMLSLRNYCLIVIIDIKGIIKRKLVIIGIFIMKFVNINDIIVFK